MSKSTFDPRLPVPTGETADPANDLFFSNSFFQRSWQRLNSLFRENRQNVLRLAHPPLVHVEKSSNQTLTGGLNTKITGWGTVNDTHGYWDATNSKYLPLVAGYYRFTASLSFDVANAVSNVYQVSLFKTGSIYAYMQGVAVDTSNIGTIQVGGNVLMDGKADYLEVFGARSHAGDVLASSGNCYLAAEFCGNG